MKTHAAKPIIRCVFYRKKRVWRGVCLDLGLLVERTTKRLVVEELCAVIGGYMEDAKLQGTTWEQARRPVDDTEWKYLLKQARAVELVPGE